MNKVISVKNLSKKFRVYEEKPTTLKEFITKVKKRKYINNSVLEGISFDIFKGETVGIIGKNGTGKSTILKIICKIVSQDEGQVSVNGKISSLLELGAGFDENFSGRQNIYFNASILGVSKKEVDLIIDKIIEFSGIEKYIDFPVRTYSSGMYMRLAFAIAINVNADILIFDEILAVGDEEFQHKCIEKIKELKEKGKTMLFVSHDMRAVKKVCDRVIWIEDKKIKKDGETEKIVNEYLESEGI